MAGRHSLTVQIDPSLPGHVAVVLSDPSGQTYAGFGPEHHWWPYDKGRFDVHPVESGNLPPPDHSSVPGGKTFTFPVSEAQARAAHEDIRKIQSEVPQYDARLGFSDPQVCSTIVSRIMKSAGLGDHLYTVPQVDLEYLTDIADTLANNPKSAIAAKSGLPIPDELRGIQSDYAFLGGGHDTPSERLGHVPNRPSGNRAPAISPSFSERFRSSPSSSNSATTPPNAPALNTGAPAVPFVQPSRDVTTAGAPATFSDRFSGQIVEADPRNIRVLARLGEPSSTTSSSNSANQVQQAGGPPGLASGQPTPDYPVPPWLFGLPDQSAASVDDTDDWYARWVKPLIQ
jgi:hypothetical protein